MQHARSSSRARCPLTWLAMVACVYLLGLMELSGSLGKQAASSSGQVNGMRSSPLAVSSKPSLKGRRAFNFGQSDHIGDGCNIAEDLVVFQGEDGPSSDGIPTYTVQILNLCFSECAIRDIHVSCGWFASASFINPQLFKRVKYGDCIVNGGKPLHAGEPFTFQYTNTFPYEMSISSANYTCLH